MYKFGKRSRTNLSTCHKDLQLIFNVVIQYFDCTVICGHRSVEEQQEIYAKGRTKPGNIVTHVDGVNKKSKHNHDPSMAVDILPYPIDWERTDQMRYFAGHVMATANLLYAQGIITHKVRWGGDWKRTNLVKPNRFQDLPHFELVKP